LHGASAASWSRIVGSFYIQYEGGSGTGYGLSVSQDGSNYIHVTNNRSYKARYYIRGFDFRAPWTQYTEIYGQDVNEEITADPGGTYTIQGPGPLVGMQFDYLDEYS